MTPEVPQDFRGLLQESTVAEGVDAMYDSARDDLIQACRGKKSAVRLTVH